MVRIWTKSVCVLLIIVVGAVCSASVSAAEASQQLIDQHESAVKLARDGDAQAGLKALNVIIKQHPNFYPAKRDYVIISTWVENCDAALDGFKRIRNESALEGYLVAPLAECLRDRRQLDQAKSLLQQAVTKNPDDTEAKEALDELTEYIRLESRPTIYARVGFNESDQGNKEWQAELKYTQEINSNMRAYYRHLFLQADEADLAEDLSRASLGLLSWFGIQYLLDVEVFTDVKISDQQGARVNLNYYPNPLWEFSIGHSSNAEDTPLRARIPSNIIKAVSTSLSSGYHSKDYRWEWSANYNYYHFSDSNERKALGTSLGYAYQLQPKQEQRVILELFSSRNSAPTGTVPYFNPEDDWSVTINLRADNVYDTDWERLVDHFTLYTGVYNQENLQSRHQGGARYELEMEFSKSRSLTLGLEYGSHVYDGQNELQTGISIAYNQKL